MKFKLIAPMFAAVACLACADGEDATPAADSGTTVDSRQTRQDSAVVHFDTWQPRDTSTTIDQAPLVDSTTVDQAQPLDATTVDQAQPLDSTTVDQAQPTDATPVDQSQPQDSTPVDQAQPLDAEDDAGQDLSCSEFLSMSQANCTEWSCVQAYRNQVCSSGETPADSLITCGLSNPDTDAGSDYTCLGVSGPCASGFDTTCQTCLNDYCAGELSDCRAHTTCN